jgi:hypothetical protein
MAFGFFSALAPAFARVSSDSDSDTNRRRRRRRLIRRRRRLNRTSNT